MKNSSAHYLQEIIYGGNDGVVTTFAVISSFAGANQSGVETITPTLILVLGIASLFADGASMGLGNFLSIRAEGDLNNSSESKLTHSMKHGIATLISFIIFGFFPLIPYLFLKESSNIYLYSIFSTFVAFLILGITRYIFTGKNLAKSILENLIVGTISAAIGFLIGRMLG